MIHSKLFQKYLAFFVCCLVLVMGISTLLLAYSFHMHRSPLLVKALGFVQSPESPIHGRFIQTSEQSHLSVKNEAVEDRFTTFSSKPDSYVHGSTEVNNFEMKKIFDEVPKMKFNKLKMNINSEKPDRSAENMANTDTIDIDDFEREKTEPHSSEEIGLIGDDKNNAAVSEKSFEKVEWADSEQSKGQTKANRKNHKNKKRKNKNNRKGKVINNYEADGSERTVIDKEIGTSLAYDVKKNIYNVGVFENAKINDDTEDDFSTYGSGSGDFPITDDTEVEEFPYYENFVVQHFSADWIDDDNRLIKTSLPGKQKLSSGGHFLKPLKQRTKSEENKVTKLKSDSKSRLDEKKLLDISASDGLFQRRNEASKTMDNKSITSIRKKQRKVKKNRKMKMNPMHENTKETLKLLERNIEEKQRDPGEFLSSSETWLETRTRRIMGNVKKSEERSRQLLLCEEAGGGELCRMLFKGHISE